MTKSKALELAKEIRDSLTDFNNVSDEVGEILYSFELNGIAFDVFAYIRKEKDDNTKNKHSHKWYAVYAGVEYDGGDNVYANYDHSTEHLRVKELANEIFVLANMYKEEKNLNELRNIIAEGK